MVRDLLFSISKLNNLFRQNQLPLHIIGAVRSEVVDAMGAMGQEVDRVVHDRGFNLMWHHKNKSIDHPLIEIIRKKIILSEKWNNTFNKSDAMERYFPAHVNGVKIETFLLDKSFYKPRDLVWRLTLAQKIYPNEIIFTEKVLHDTEIEYSSKLWDEVKYELSASYSEREVESIEQALGGSSNSFELDYIQERFDELGKFSDSARSLLLKRSVREILIDLYRLGAIGNSYRVGSSGKSIKDGWYFRGDPNLLPHKRMVVHPALIKRLSIVAPRKRGS